MIDHAAKLTLTEPEAFAEFIERTLNLVARGQSLTDCTRAWHGDIRDRVLLSRWRDCYQEVSEIYRDADPSRRVAWAGPAMSVAILHQARGRWKHGRTDRRFSMRSANRELSVTESRT